MTKLTVTSRGQVTFKKEILQHLGIRPGDKIELQLLPEGKGMLQASKPVRKIDEFVGLLARKAQRAATLEEIDAAIADGWASKK